MSSSYAAPGRADGLKPVLRVGVFENGPTMILDRRERPRGFIVDLMRAISQELGVDIRYRFCDLPECLDLLEAGAVDLVPDIPLTANRRGALPLRQGIDPAGLVTALSPR